MEDRVESGEGRADRASRRIVSEAEWREVLEEYERSGQSKTEYCAQKGVSKSALYQAIKRAKGAGTEPRLVDVTPLRGVRAEVEVELPSGMIVRGYSGVPLERVSRLVSLVRGSR